MTDIDALAKNPMGTLAERYLTLRNMKKEIEDNAKRALEPVSAALDSLSAAMMAKLHTEGAQSQKTPHGTVYLTTTTTSDIVDFDALWEFVKTHDAPELFQRRVTISEVERYNEANPDQPVSGVVVQKVQQVRVRTA